MLRHDARTVHKSGRTRAGLTLIELVVALSIGGMILAGAHAVLVSLSDEEQAITLRSITSDATANGLRMLRSLAGRIEAGAPDDTPFVGTPDSVHFTTWCEEPEGWLERCAVTLAIDTVKSAAALTAHIAGRPPVILMSDIMPGGLRYLESAGNGGEWFRHWGIGISTPLAIGVLISLQQHEDTVIVRIGARG